MAEALLLDDEILVTEAIRKNVHWDRCGIQKVHICDSAGAAKKIIAERKIDLILSDIEMPGTDGFSFVSWLRRDAPELPVIFITGFAEFEYARKAISLNVEEYILKPVDYRELEEKICAVMQRAAQRRQSGQAPSAQDEERFSEFVRHALALEREPAAEEAADILSRYGLSLPEDKRYLLVWIQSRSRGAAFWEMAGQIKRELLDTFREKTDRVLASSFTEGKLLALLTCSDLDRLPPQACRDEVTAILRKRKKTCCFLSEMLAWNQVIPMLRRLGERDAGNVLYQDRAVVVAHDSPALAVSPASVNFGEWAMLLSEGELEVLSQRVDNEVRRLIIGDQMDAETLRTLYQHFMQIMYHYIGENYFSRESIVQDSKLAGLQKLAMNSVDDFLDFTHYFLALVLTAAREDGGKGIIEDVKHYINKNLGEKLTRTGIAEQVSLNESYLSRLFHKETGMSISDYITAKRIALARQLLIQTNLSISAVGEKSGYESTAYFVRVFKKETGKTPKEYRRNTKI